MIPKIVDLFSGCGGLTLGFEKEGFELAFGIELNKEAVETISFNFNYRYGKETSHLCADITKVDAHDFKSRIGKEGCIVIGGPPCQAYSIAGRAKLNSLGGEREYSKDSRGFLYKDFLRFALDLDARAVVMENVPEAVDFGGVNVPEDVCSILDKNGYNAFWTILNSADYGVPQIRERIFVIAIKKQEKKSVNLPFPTNNNSFNQTTKNSKRIKGFNKNSYFKEPLKNHNAPSWITVGEAFSDLPVLIDNHTSYHKKISVSVAKKYREKTPLNDFQKKMRNWYGFSLKTVTANSYRKNERDYHIFEKMKQGDDYINASIIADNLFNEKLRLYGVKENDREKIKRIHNEIVPKADRNKFSTKWRKLDENLPSHTVVAHLSKDTYSHIHPWEPRGISVREAARLQSFPDDFCFKCSMGEAFKQIGNAVPPLLACGVAKELMKVFKED